MSDMITSRRVADSGTPEWYAARSTGIGASEAAAALGESKHKDPFLIFQEKRGLVPMQADNDAMRLGRAMESVVIGEFVHRVGIPVQYAPCPMLRHPLTPWVIATPDALLADGSLLEAKTTTWRTELGNDEGNGDPLIPVEWACQAQQQMYVTGAMVVHFGVLVDGRKWKQYTVHRNDDAIAGIVDAETELWERIQNNDPPEPNWQHASTPGLIKSLYRDVHEGTITLSGEAAMAWDAYERLGKEARRIDKDREMLKARVLSEIGNASGGVLPGGRRMVRRSITTREEHTVKRTEFVSVRAVEIK